MLITGQLLVGD